MLIRKFRRYDFVENITQSLFELRILLNLLSNPFFKELLALSITVLGKGFKGVLFDKFLLVASLDRSDEALHDQISSHA